MARKATLKGALMMVISDSFNRALRALEDAGAVDATVLRRDYKPGSKCYELVTQQFELAIEEATPVVRDSILREKSG